jgi:hypothetical protein
VELFVFYLVDGFTLAWFVFGKRRQEIVPMASLSSLQRPAVSCTTATVDGSVGESQMQQKFDTPPKNRQVYKDLSE